MIIFILGEVEQPGKQEEMSSPWRQQAVSPLVLIVAGFPHRVAPSAAVTKCRKIETTGVVHFMSTARTLNVDIS